MITKDKKPKLSPMLRTMPSSFYTQQSEPSPRSNHIGLAKLQKKQYPLNLTLFSSESPRIRMAKPELNESIPDFASDFISFTAKPKYLGNSKIDSRFTFNSTFHNTRNAETSLPRDLHPPVSLFIPSISYENVKTEKNAYNSEHSKPSPKVYQPNTIYFSNRSKMTLYTHAPILCNMPLRRPLPNKRNIQNDFMNFVQKQKASEKKTEAAKFGDNLKKIREIIKDPLIYEQ